MENASRALMIAGAVLIVLIVIGIAVNFFYNSSTIGEIFNDDITDLDIKLHNNDLLRYEGVMYKEDVINLIMYVSSNNKNNTKMPIRLTINNTKELNSDNLDEILNEISNFVSQYNVSMEYNELGYIDNVNIRFNIIL